MESVYELEQKFLNVKQNILHLEYTRQYALSEFKTIINYGGFLLNIYYEKKYNKLFNQIVNCDNELIVLKEVQKELKQTLQREILLKKIQ